MILLNRISTNYLQVYVTQKVPLGFGIKKAPSVSGEG
jgi:hypothetical protein